MSISKPTEDRTPNPCKNWMSWDSATKMFKKWDKEVQNIKDPSKMGENVAVPLPFQFIVLDVLFTIAGHNDKENKPIMANEVRTFMDNEQRGTKAEVLSVKIAGKEVAKGIYVDVIKKVQGADFANSVYIGYFDANKVMQLGNLKLRGSAVGAFIEAETKLKKLGKKMCGSAFKVATSVAGEKGAVKFNSPVFGLINLKPETVEKAVAMDVILQEYLDEYFATPQTTNSALNASPAEAIIEKVASATNQANGDFLDEMNAPVTSESNFEEEDF